MDELEEYREKNVELNNQVETIDLNDDNILELITYTGWYYGYSINVFAFDGEQFNIIAEFNDGE